MLDVLRVRVEWNEDNNVQKMWEQVKQAMVNGEGEVCSSVMGGGQKT